MAEDFKGQLVCLEENTKKYTRSSVPIKEENENGRKIKSK